MSATASQPKSSQTKVDDESLLTSWLRIALVWVVLILVVMAVWFLPSDLRAYSVLMHFADPDASGALLRFESRAVTTEDVTIAMPDSASPVRARLYVPKGVKHPNGMVAVHGIHHLGMDEPRLVSFARAVASSGILVLTPQLDDLADYHVTATSIPAIGESAVWLDNRVGDKRVIVTGISFAGGLSLLAAANGNYRSHMRALVLMGAYDDLARVSRFLATGQQELPDGRVEPHQAHDYGASVFVYSHLAQFFPADDLDAAHEALRDWLWEQPDKAKVAMEKLSPPARATMDALLNRQIDNVRPRILAAIQEDSPELAEISPHGKIGDLHLPVYILHGWADNIIPPAESLWIAQDLPKSSVRDLLITKAFSHVDPEKHAALGDELKLVQFVGGVLRAAN